MTLSVCTSDEIQYNKAGIAFVDQSVFFYLQEIINAGLVPLIIQTLETVSVFCQVDKISQTFTQTTKYKIALTKMFCVLN